MRGVRSPQQWQMFKSSIIGRATIERRWRLRVPSGDPAGAVVQFEIDPPITGDTTSTFVYEYVSRNWCASKTLEQAVSAVVVGGGNNYKAGDTIVPAGGTSTVAAVLTVLSVGPGGVIMSLTTTPAQLAAPVEITTPGNYSVVPGNPVSQLSTSGMGSGATFTMGWGNLTQPDWAADTDVALLDEDVIELGIIWRLQHRLGLDYGEEKAEFDNRLDLLIARDGGTATLDLAPYDRLTLVGPYNVPETGFGPS